MKLYTPIRTFNGYGGGAHFSPVSGLLALSEETFGTALQEIELTLCFQSSQPFENQRVDQSLRPSFNEFHNRFCSTLPTSRFLRKKGTLKLEVLAEFASAEEMEQPTLGQFNLPWQSAVLDILIEEMNLCRRKFRKTDDFRPSEFIDWLRLQHQNLPQTQAEAQALADQLQQLEEQELNQLSEWDRLAIDWTAFHPDARDIVDDPNLWSTGHEFAPHGNDNGADLLANFRSQKSRWAKDEGRSFYRNLARDWGFDPEAVPDDSINYLMKRQATIGLAFAFLKLFADCPAWLAEKAIQELNDYEAYLMIHHADWEHREECRSYLTAMLKCLQQHHQS